MLKFLFLFTIACLGLVIYSYFINDLFHVVDFSFDFILSSALLFIEFKNFKEAKELKRKEIVCHLCDY